MGFCDKNGTMICPNVEKTEKHKSWINLCVLDADKKAIHDRWEEDMRNYNRDLDYYNKVEAQYEADMHRIDRKDRMYDTQLAALDSERNAIKQEIETLKTVAKDNVERTFKLFG